MEDTLDIPTQTTFQEDPPVKKLWKGLYDGKKYTKSFEDFKKQFSTPEAIIKLHKGLQEDGDYTKSVDDFQQQFFQDVKKKSTLPSPLASTQLPSQKKLAGSIQVGDIQNAAGVYLDKSGDMIYINNNGKAVVVGDAKDSDKLGLPSEDDFKKLNPNVDYSGVNSKNVDPISLAQEADELGKRTKIVNPGGGSSFAMGTDLSVNQPDEESINKSKELNKQVEAMGFDPKKLVSDFADIPEGVHNMPGFSKPELLTLSKDNPQKYERTIGAIKGQSQLFKQINSLHGAGNLSDTEADYLSHDISTSVNAINSTEDYDVRRKNIQRVMSIVDQYGGEKKADIMRHLGIDFSYVYGKEAGDIDQLSHDERYKRGDINSNQLAAIHYYEDVMPEKLNSLKSAFLTEEQVKDNPDDKLAKDEAQRNLAELGIKLRQSYLQEKLNPLQKEHQLLLDKSAKEGLTPDELDRAQQLELEGSPYQQQKEMSIRDQQLLGSQFPLSSFYDAKSFAQELVGQEHGYLNHFMAKVGEATKNTGAGIYDFAAEPFRSQQESELRQSEILGGRISDRSSTYVTGVNDFKPDMSPELKSQIDVIKKDKSLEYDDRLKAVTKLLMQHTDEWGRTPTDSNISFKKLAYGVSDMAAGLVPFMGLEIVTGGGATAGLARKFTSEFISAAATSFEDSVADGIERGEKNPYAYATRVTAINSAAIALGGRADKIKKYFSEQKTAIGNLVSKMSDAAIEADLKQAPKSLSKFKNAFNAVKEKSIQAGKSFGSSAVTGFKDAAKINAFMTGGKIANDAISGELKTADSYGKDFMLETLKFGIFSTLAGAAGKAMRSSDMATASIYEAATNKDAVLSHLDEKIKEGSINPIEGAEIKRNVEAAAKIVNGSPIFKTLDADAKREYLRLSLVEKNNTDAAKGLPDRQAAKFNEAAEVAMYKKGFVVEPKTPEQLTKRKEQLEKSLIPEKDAEGKNIEIPEKEIFAAKAEIEAINQVLDEYEKTKPAEATTPTVNEALNNYNGVFSKETTGMVDPDNSLKGNIAGRKATIEMMSPDEYLKRVREGFGDEKDDNINKYSAKFIKEAIRKGEKIPMPYLMYTKQGEFNMQEGRNRAVVARERGEKLIPVLVDRELPKENKPTTQKEPIERAKEIANSGEIKGFSAAPLKEAANNNPEEFNNFLQNIAEQSQDPKSKTEAIKAYGQELVDIANELHPPKEPIPPTGEGTVNDLPFGNEDTTGISHGAAQVRSLETGLPQPVHGEGVTVQEAIQHGQQLLSEGGDADKAAADFQADPKKNISYDALSLVRAKHETLVRAANKAIDEFGENSKQGKDALKAENDWYTQVVKPMQTEWSKIGQAQQGRVDIDTGSYVATKRAIEDVSGKPLTDKQAKIVKDLTGKVKDLNKQVEDLQKKFTDAVDRSVNEGEVVESKTFAKTAKTVADKFRKLKAKVITFKDSEGNDIPIQQAGVSWNDLVELGAKAIEKTGQIIDGIKAIVEKVKDEDWYKKLSEKDKDKFEKDLTNHYSSLVEETPEAKNIKRLEKQLEDLRNGNVPDSIDKRKLSAREKGLIKAISEQKKSLGLNEKVKPPTGSLNNKTEADKFYDLATKFADKEGNDFTPKEVKEIWQYAKDNYIDKGKDVPTMLKGVSDDLGLTYKQVLAALEKPKGAKVISDAMFLAQNRRAAAANKVKQYARTANTPRLVKYLKAIPNFFFRKAIFGHGTVGMITHAGMNIFRPTIAKTYWKNFARQFKNSFGAFTKKGMADYEKNMEALKNDPLFITAKRAGVKVDPTEKTDDYTGVKKWLANLKISGAGDRGFNALKQFRMDYFTSEYNRLSDEEKNDPETLKALGRIINHATGTSDFIPGGAMDTIIFAPRLEASKWERIITDPFKAINTLGRWNKATLAEKASAKFVARKTGEVFATYLSALGINQALLYATGSNQSVNFTDPTKKDWLKFKVGGENLDASGGIVSTLGFIARLLTLPWQTKKDLKGKTKTDALVKEVTDYGFSKMSPFAATGKDIITSHDFVGNTMPWSDDKPLHKYNHKLTWKEYLWNNQAPIPVSEAARSIYQSMEDRGMSEPQISDVLTGIMKGFISGGTGAKVATDFSVEEKKSGRR